MTTELEKTELEEENRGSFWGWRSGIHLKIGFGPRLAFRWAGWA